MKTLIIHHLEPLWERGYQMHGTSFDSLQEKFAEYLAENEFDKVILTRFEDYRMDSLYFPEFGRHVSEVHEYGYGWPASCLEENPNEFVQGGSHSESVLIADWMKELKNDLVFISGAFRGECLQDLEIALDAVGAKYQHVNELCVG